MLWYKGMLKRPCIRKHDQVFFWSASESSDHHGMQLKIAQQPDMPRWNETILLYDHSF
jgi:hypothetical protein